MTYTPTTHRFFFFNDTATTEIYTLSLHDALPILFLMSRKIILIKQELLLLVYELNRSGLLAENEKTSSSNSCRSEERFSRNAETDIVCRLLLEKKNTPTSASIRFQSCHATCAAFT